MLSQGTIEVAPITPQMVKGTPVTVAVRRAARSPDALDALYPRLATYRARTTHAIPVVELVEV